MFDSVRTRLTLWHTGALALALIVFSLSVYYLSETKLRQRLDAEVRTTTEGIARLLIYEFNEGESESQAVHSALNEHYFPNQAAAIFDAEGRLLSEKSLPDNHRAKFPTGLSIPGDTIQLMTVPDKDDTPPKEGALVRMATQRVTIANRNKSYVVVVSQTLEPLAEELETLRRILLMTVPLALVMAGLGGWVMARKSLLPVVAMSESARRIGVENLAHRLPIANPRDELGQLALTFNELLDRLQSAFAQQRQFMADASHELRTPLSVMRTAAAVTLEQPQREEKEYGKGLNGFEQGPGLMIDLPIFNRNGGAISRAEADIERAAKQLAATRHRVALEVQQAYAQLEQERQSLERWRTTVQPQIREELRRAERAYAAGDVAYLLVLQTAQRQTDAQLREVELQTAQARAAANLERSIGRRLIANR